MRVCRLQLVEIHRREAVILGMLPKAINSFIVALVRRGQVVFTAPLHLSSHNYVTVLHWEGCF